MQCISFLLLVTDCQAAGCSLPALAESHRAGGASAPGPSLEKGPPRPPGLLAGPFPESGARRPCILLAGGWQCPLWPSPWLSHQVSTVRRYNHARFYNLKQAPGPAHSHGEGDTMGWSPPPAREVKLQQGLREGPPHQGQGQGGLVRCGERPGGRWPCRGGVPALPAPHPPVLRGVPAQHARPSVVLRLICWHEAFRSSLTMLPQEVLAA